MPKPFNVTFTEAAKAAAEASSLSLEAVEAKARAEIFDHVIWIGEPVNEEMELPSWGFHGFEMPDGQEFFTTFNGPDNAEVDAVARHESLGRIEEKVDWLGVEGEVFVPVRASEK